MPAWQVSPAIIEHRTRTEGRVESHSCCLASETIRWFLTVVALISFAKGTAPLSWVQIIGAEAGASVEFSLWP